MYIFYFDPRMLNLGYYIYKFKLLRTNSVIKNKKEFCDSISII